MPIAAIYARVSSDKQREESTIASQTAALIEFARSRGYQVPTEWVFEDEGYSGASLVRPGLERVRDLAAEGQIEAVLVYAPDRLSRKYAYQILLIEELARHGVETVFMKAPQAATAEDQLLVQFQGMIAEYERAQILERSRRGKRHRARQGQVNVLSGAPYGYRYVRKSDDAAARYEIIDAEADIVRMVYDRYIVAGMSIGAITRLLNERGVPTRKQISRWERSTVWAMLRNPAYKGTACFGKTETAPRQRITRPLRLRGGIGSRDSAHHERPRADWIEIAVPAIVDEDTFARAQELLEQNKKLAPRRTITPSIVQGLVSCSKCGYALSRPYVAATTGDFGLVLCGCSWQEQHRLSSPVGPSWRSTSCFLRRRVRSVPPRSCVCPIGASRTCSFACAGPTPMANRCVRAAAARSATRAAGWRVVRDGAAKRAAVTSRLPRALCSLGTSCRSGPICSPSLPSATRSKARACSLSPGISMSNTRPRSCWRTSCARPLRPARKRCALVARDERLRSTAPASAAMSGRRTWLPTGSTAGSPRTNRANARSSW